jgi:hypothetical protein
MSTFHPQQEPPLQQQQTQQPQPSPQQPPYQTGSNGVITVVQLQNWGLNAGLFLSILVVGYIGLGLWKRYIAYKWNRFRGRLPVSSMPQVEEDVEYVEVDELPPPPPKRKVIAVRRK